MTAIDCGAHVGRYTRFMAATGAEVHAFEPNPHAYGVLASRFDGQRNVRCYQAAVSDRTGCARLYLHHGAEADPVGLAVGSTLIKSKTNVDEHAFLEVDTIDLAAFIGRLPQPPVLLKLDVEGAEVAILQRMIDTGQLVRIRHVLVEMHDGKAPELVEPGRDLREQLARPHFRHVRLDWE